MLEMEDRLSGLRTKPFHLRTRPPLYPYVGKYVCTPLFVSQSAKVCRQQDVLLSIFKRDTIYHDSITFYK